MSQEQLLDFSDNTDRLQELEGALNSHPTNNRINELSREYGLPQKYGEPPVPRAPFIGIYDDNQRERQFREDALTIFKQASEKENDPLLQQYWEDQAALLELGDHYYAAREAAPETKSAFAIWQDLVDNFINHRFHYAPSDYRQQLRDIVQGEGQKQIMAARYGPTTEDLPQF